jgi:glycosyltransferase involved in cell wall biosynthesis/Ser/Thr protein kinase RdoA (MazF antagonist)
MTLSLSSFLLPRPKRVAQAIGAFFSPSNIDVDQVSVVLDQFGLQLVGAPKNVATGRRNRNLVVHTDQGRKVLRRYRDGWPLSTIAYEHSILARLAELNFPAPRLVTTVSGSTFLSAMDGNYALFDFVDGANIVGRYLTAARLQRLRITSGELLARLHSDLEGFLPQGRHHLGFDSYSESRRRDLAWYEQTIARLKERSVELAAGPSVAGAQVDDARWLARNADEVLERIADLRQTLAGVELPRAVIHGDFGLHNLLFQSDRSATVLDFELARLEWRLSEIVMIMGRAGLERSGHILAAYQDIYPLTGDEWHVLPQVWQLRNLEGAVQNWNTYFEQGIEKNLAAARTRIARADFPIAQAAELRELRSRLETRPGKRTPRVFMIVRLFYPWIGGTERQAHKLALQLKEQGVPVEIVTGWWFRGTPRRETLDGLPVFRNFTLWQFFGIKGLRKFGGYLYILTLIYYLWRRRADYDVLHVHGLNYHTFAANLAGRWFDRPTIAKLANSGQASDVLKMRQDRQLALARYMLPVALQCDRFVAINETIVDELVTAGVSPERIVCFGNGVESDRIQPKINYGLGDPPRLLYVGRLHPQKGLDVLLQAIRILTEEPAQLLDLRLIGDGPARGELTTLADQLGLNDRVTFCGQSDQVMEELAAADIFVLPSRAEGLSNALLEAMAAGLPSLVSNIPGNVDVVEHERNGLLFRAEDPQALAECLTSLLEQEDLRRRLGREARQTVETRFSLETIATRYANLYEQVIQATV